MIKTLSDAYGRMRGTSYVKEHSIIDEIQTKEGWAVFRESG